MCGVSANINQEEVPSQLGKNKSLPKWISSLAQVEPAVLWPSYVT